MAVGVDNGQGNAEYLAAYDANVASLLCMTITRTVQQGR